MIPPGGPRGVGSVGVVRTAAAERLQHQVVSTSSRGPMFEDFRIKGAEIQQVEAVFITVPYNMPSPWVSR